MDIDTQKQKSIKESVVEAYLVKKTKARGGRAVKLAQITGRGFPDRTVILPGGVVLYIETKRPVGGRLSPHQEHWRDDLIGLGCRYALCSTKEEIDETFAAYDESGAYERHWGCPPRTFI